LVRAVEILVTGAKVAAVHYPFLAHFERAIDVAPDGPYLEINEYLRRNSGEEIERQVKKTLSYFDIMNLAPRIKCFCSVQSPQMPKGNFGIQIFWA